jgi:hypothetical protein
MPSLLHMHGFRRGVKTVKLDATSARNETFVVRLPKAMASVEYITQNKTSVIAVSPGESLLLRPRDTVTLFLDDSQIVMLVLGVHPLAALCQRRGVIDRAILLLAVA